MLDGLSWGWIALMAIAPLPVALLLSFPIWRRRETILGNIAGTAVIFTTGVALVFRESAAVDVARRACYEAGRAVCSPVPTLFTRHAIYSGLALAEVVALFAISLKVEHQVREQDYAPEWRR